MTKKTAISLRVGDTIVTTDNLLSTVVTSACEIDNNNVVLEIYNCYDGVISVTQTDIEFMEIE